MIAPHFQIRPGATVYRCRHDGIGWKAEIFVTERSVTYDTDDVMAISLVQSFCKDICKVETSPDQFWGFALPNGAAPWMVLIVHQRMVHEIHPLDNDPFLHDNIPPHAM